MANEPRKNCKTRRKRKRKMMTGASFTTTTTGKKFAKTKDQPGHLQGELNHAPIQPPPAAACNAGEGQQEEDTAADKAAARREEPPGEQEQERAAAAAVTTCRRDDDTDDDDRATCCICGAARWHNEHFCAWNYMDGRVGANCRQGCGPRQHAASSAAACRRRRDALRRFVRVTNLPSSLSKRELERLFQRFGPLRMSVITTMMAPPGSAGFGYVAFKKREHAEEAIDKLNGHHVGDRKLRVDWAYPRA